MAHNSYDFPGQTLMGFLRRFDIEPVNGWKPYQEGFHNVIAIPDSFGHESIRRQLWNLADYRVSSVSGGTIWLSWKGME